MPYCPLTKEYEEECGECEMCSEESESDVWERVKQEQREKKERNLKWSTEFLISKGIPFKKLSDYHYRLEDYNFWPSTGKYIRVTAERNGYHKTGRGVKNLVREIERAKEKKSL